MILLTKVKYYLGIDFDGKWAFTTTGRYEKTSNGAEE